MSCPFDRPSRRVKRIQSPQPVCCVDGGLGVVSRGKIRCQFHLPFGGRSSTTSGRTITASSIQMRFRSSETIEYVARERLDGR